ncbi:uncharacterized protein B0I36DRAFT_344525 [Microdochium trichocladiopsis]|uniref:Uncharacterized protein n=1 Tax=Microdochium trichocladiopsis TaxID=1682393 RepID=A0A9P8YIY7_9PEZI|nr:uncharacterized protein B0I36DRAFT_344525 [Microdochium trichocladiopsis]KAH7040852.1 hypothetical protein B0I36DRAFT_344525 [Microdochium trichocladiopsis]
MGYDEDGHNELASDVITYVGVPLAVLGVLPILYNTIATLAALSKIKRMLRHSKLKALTRSDIVNRVIEVELPRYAVQPWDRFDHRNEYWQLSRQPSQIPGGTWTTFNWRTNMIGIKTQRVEYADQLRQPQVEVALDQLVAYLLDLGAIPDPHGWKLLRSTGLWTPMGTALMTSPDGQQRALTIGPLDDSDGHLSLKVEWSSSWTTRDFASLPPYWVKLPAPPPKRPKTSNTGEASTSQSTHEQDEQDQHGLAQAKIKAGSVRESLDSVQKDIDKTKAYPITCEISSNGLMAALSQPEMPFTSTANLESLYANHLRISHTATNGVWFASTATAYGTSSQTILWNYKIPDDILNFARRDTVPCGILVLLDIVDLADTPEWATAYDNGLERHELFVRRTSEQRAAMAAEARMSPAERQIAASNRQRREMEQRMNDMRDEQRQAQQRRDARFLEALQSPKWETGLVADRCLKVLKRRSLFEEDVELRDAAGMILHRMVLDGEFTTSMVKILDLWKAWADNGGMRRSDYEAISGSIEIFAQATLMVAMIKGTVTAHEGTLSMDLQECMRMWKMVRLG